MTFKEIIKEVYSIRDALYACRERVQNLMCTAEEFRDGAELKTAAEEAIIHQIISSLEWCGDSIENAEEELTKGIEE